MGLIEKQTNKQTLGALALETCKYTMEIRGLFTLSLFLATSTVRKVNIKYVAGSTLFELSHIRVLQLNFI